MKLIQDEAERYEVNGYNMEVAVDQIAEQIQGEVNVYKMNQKNMKQNNTNTNSRTIQDEAEQYK